MFTIRRKKKTPQPGVSPDHEKLVSTNYTIRSLLSAAVTFRQWQKVLTQYLTLTPDQRVVLAPLIEAKVEPSLTILIQHAETHGLITFEQAARLRDGRVIVHSQDIQ